MEIVIGAKYRVSDNVTKEKTALAVGSGGLEVYATPCMSALMEKAAFTLLSRFLPEGNGSVGISLSLEHSSATPVGLDVTAEAEITDVSGRIVTFSISAWDEKGEIGRCIHKRCIVENERFAAKAAKKLDK